MAKHVKYFYVKTMYGTQYYYQTEGGRYYFVPLGVPDCLKRISKKEFEYRSILSIGGVKTHEIFRHSHT